jgi:hypothetical protein
MSKSPNIGLELTPENTEMNFIDWRLGLSGDDDKSNMMLLDKEIGELKTHNEEVDSSGLTWGMLRSGLGWKKEKNDT